MSRQFHSPSLNSLNAFLITFFRSLELSSSSFSSSSDDDDVEDLLSSSRLSPSSSSSSVRCFCLLALSACGFPFLTGRSFEIERESSSSSSEFSFLPCALVCSGGREISKINRLRLRVATCLVFWFYF